MASVWGGGQFPNPSELASFYETAKRNTPFQVSSETDIVQKLNQYGVKRSGKDAQSCFRGAFNDGAQHCASVFEFDIGQCKGCNCQAESNNGQVSICCDILNVLTQCIWSIRISLQRCCCMWELVITWRPNTLRVHHGLSSLPSLYALPSHSILFRFALVDAAMRSLVTKLRNDMIAKKLKSAACQASEVHVHSKAAMQG